MLKRNAANVRVRAAVWLACLIAGHAHATWSIVAVDPSSGAVGFAGATCGIGIEYVAAVVPGHGVVAAQADTSFIGRDHARDWIAAGDPASLVVVRLADPALYRRPLATQPASTQYGVATIQGTHADAGAYSGNGIPDWFGAVTADDHSVQGNTLRGPDVVARAAAAFAARADARSGGSCRPALADRLLAALEAGRDAGGDKRCPREAPALSAALIVALPGDSADAPTVSIVAPRHVSFVAGIWYAIIGYEPGPDEGDPVATVRARYDALRCAEERTNSP